MEMKRLILLLTLTSLVFLSCKKEEDDQPTGPVETPPENVIGTVTDQNGAPLANVQMHIVYSVLAVPTSPLDDSQNPTQAIFWTEQTLTTDCDSDVPLAEGTNIYVMWDADNDHTPSAGDRLPTLCTTEPCGFQTVNFNQFTLNGIALGLGAGMFGTELAFSTYGEHLDPSRFYLEIRCTDGNVLWRSEMVDVPDGLSDQPLDSVHCFACVGSPVGETTLGFAYPNPAHDEVTIPFTLRANSDVTISTRSLSTGAVATRFQGAVEQGIQTRSLDISEIPNGLYVYSMNASGFAGQDTLLKNVSNNSDLRGEPALAITDSEGKFKLNTPYGAMITLRGASSDPLGESLPLDSVRIVALINGYLPADTTIALSAAEQHTLNLRLLPE